jgi:hypothetical protein
MKDETRRKDAHEAYVPTGKTFHSKERDNALM